MSLSAKLEIKRYVKGVCTMRKLGILLFVYFSFINSVMAEAVKCKEIETVWKPAIDSLCGENGMGYQRSIYATHPAKYDQRNRCLEAPDGKSKALQMRTFRGLYNSLMDYNRAIDGLAATHVKFSVQMYMDPNFEYFTGGRLPIGIKIGPVGVNTNCIGGGCPPEKQDGSSVRVNYNSETSKDGVRRLVLKAYSYHMNRNTPRKNFDNPWGPDRPPVSSMFGDNFPLNGTIPYGRWVTVKLEVKLNRIGHDDGYINFEASWVGPNGKITRTGGATGLRYRDAEDSPKWKIVGVYLTDKFNTQEPAPASQSMYFRGYKMTTCE